jgi:hypothetical protein
VSRVADSSRDEWMAIYRMSDGLISERQGCFGRSEALYGLSVSKNCVVGIRVLKIYKSRVLRWTSIEPLILPDGVIQSQQLLRVRLVLDDHKRMARMVRYSSDAEELVTLRCGELLTLQYG